MKKALYLILLMVLFFGCKPTLKQKVIGFYSIDEIIYKQQNIKNDLGVNTISFDEDGMCSLPSMRIVSPIKSEKEKAEWVVNKIDTTLRITANHVVFNGTYNLRFEKDYETKLLKLILENENVYLKASKGLKDFDSHKDNW